VVTVGQEDQPEIEVLNHGAKHHRSEIELAWRSVKNIGSMFRVLPRERFEKKICASSI
jgi:hypothetical protein